jgi:hypothetical protein
MLADLFGVNLHAVMGYPGSADKRIAIERGELDGDCGSWTSLPDDWLRDNKITLLVRFSRTLLPDMPASLGLCGRSPRRCEEEAGLNLLAAGAVGRPYIAPRAVPADRLAALRAAFDATMKDPEFLADADKLRLLVTPMTGAQVESYIRELYRTPSDVIAAAKEISGE